MQQCDVQLLLLSCFTAWKKKLTHTSLRLSTFHVFFCVRLLFILLYIIYYILYIIYFIYLFFFFLCVGEENTLIHASPERQVALMLAVICQEKRR